MPRPTTLRTWMISLALCAGAFTPAPTVFAATAADALIQATDLLKLKHLEAPAVSPDGRWVVYVVRSMEPKPETKSDWIYATHLWLAATDGSTPPRQLTRLGNDSSPAWHPAGDKIVFVRTSEKEKPQLFTLPLSGGEAQLLTKLETGATAPRWSPDGSRVLFTSTLNLAQIRTALEKTGTMALPPWRNERPGRTANDTANWTPRKSEKNGKPTQTADDETEHVTPKTAKPKANPNGTLQERREWLAENEADGNPRLLVRLGFLNESDINPEQTFNHLYVLDAHEGAEPRDLTPGYHSFGSAKWMIDGKSIVCTAAAKLDEHPDRSEHNSIYLVDAATGGVKVFLEQQDFSLGNPTPSPDGKWIALTATPGEALGYGQAVVTLVPASGGAPKMLTEKLDRNAGNLQWSADSRSIYFVAATNGSFPLYRVDLAGGETTRLTATEAIGVRDYALTAKQLVQILTAPTNPSELHAGPLDPRLLGGKASTALTTHNSAWLAEKKLSDYEPHSLVTKEGLTVQFWTMKPADFDPAKKYPLLLEIHGGPSAMWGPGEDSMWFEFQYFAARGFALVFANPRGSGGYGYAFQRANYKDWGTGPASDILSAVDFAAQESHVDRARQVLTGGSYGGYMTTWIIGHDHRFKAAVAQRGVYDLATFFGEGNAWRLVPRAFGGYPWQPETRRLLERESPLTYVEAITTPLLIQHGDNDRRTGFVQSEMLLRSLKVLGRDVEEVRYPRATHEMSRSGEPKQRLDSLVRYEEFFRRYLGEN